MEQIADNRLEQVKFLRTLAEDFDHFNEMYEKARPILAEYEKTPKKMETEGEWGRVVDALNECQKSVKFLYRIALLTKSGVINKDLLYVFYYDEIADVLTFKLSHLIKWCGTGLDLAANYSSVDLARIVTTLLSLVEELDVVHQEHGADLHVEGYSELIERFKEWNRDFLSNPGQFDVASPDYLDRYVTVRKKRG